MVFKGKAWAIWESSSSSFLGLSHMYKRYTMTCTPIYILEKTLMLEKIEGRRRRLKAKREEGGRGWDGWMVSATQRTWVWTPGDSEGQGSLACCSPWGRRVRHDLATEQQQQYVLLSFCLSPTNPFSIGGEGLSQEHRRVERKLFFLPCSDKVGGVEMSC